MFRAILSVRYTTGLVTYPSHSCSGNDGRILQRKGKEGKGNWVMNEYGNAKNAHALMLASDTHRAVVNVFAFGERYAIHWGEGGRREGQIYLG